MTTDLKYLKEVDKNSLIISNHNNAGVKMFSYEFILHLIQNLFEMLLIRI